MAALPLTWNSPNKAEIEYHGNFVHTIGRIQHISHMSRIDIYYATFFLATQTVAPTLPGFQGIKICVKYLASHPYKPIFYPSGFYDGSNVIRLTWSWNQVEYYTTQNCLEWHQDADHYIIINRKRSVSVIIHTLIGVDFWCKVQIQPSISSDSTDGYIRCMHKATN